MLFGYGSFRCEEGEARPTSWTEVITRSARHVPTSVVRSLGVEFDIIKPTQQGIHDRLAQIYAACNSDGLDVGFYLDTGGKSHYFMTNAITTSGVLVVQRPIALPSDDADYATHLKASAAFMAHYDVATIFGSAIAEQVLDYGETVAMIGTGGPRKVLVDVDTGPPQQYTLTDQTRVIVQQSGFIVQSVPGVVPNPYVAPEQYLVSEGRTLIPSVSYNSRSGQVEYSLRWDFTFELPFFQVFNPVLR